MTVSCTVSASWRGPTPLSLANYLISLDNFRIIRYELKITAVLRRPTMNKSTLIETLRKETNLTKSKSEEVVELFFDEMSNALTNGDRVQIRGLFGFQVREYKGYTGGNPSRYR
jgi:nucleoid DNA-binding protein